MPRWFLVLNGVALLCMGVALLAMRLRERASQNAAAARDRAAARKNWRAAAAGTGIGTGSAQAEAEPEETDDAGPRYRGRVGLRMAEKSAAPVGVFGLFWGILWALLCCAAGIVLLLMSQGHIIQPGRAPDTAPPHSRGLEFPSGR